MGARIEYWEVPAGENKKAITEDYELLSSWYISTSEEFPEDVNYDLQK